VSLLGTPHRGSNKANFALFIAKILRPIHHFNTKILATLKTTTIVGWDWKNRYINAIRHRSKNTNDPIMLFYFFESLGLPFIGKVWNIYHLLSFSSCSHVEVVKKDSAVLEHPSDISREQSLPANHMDMAKIESYGDIKFTRIWTPISQVLDTLHSHNGKDREVSPH
jgi:hypothetical protein